MDTETLSPQSGEKMVPTATVALVTFLIYGVNIHTMSSMSILVIQYYVPSFLNGRDFRGFKKVMIPT